MADFTHFSVQPLAGAIGALVDGIDLQKPLSAAAIAEMRAAWLTYGVIFLRNQPLSPAAFQAFAEHFGKVIEYPFVQGIAGFPLIIPVLKLPHERNNFGGIWHTDTAYLDEPPMGTPLNSCALWHSNTEKPSCAFPTPRRLPC